MVFCVTTGLIAPGVLDASGSELCARAPLADRVARTKITAALDHIAVCPLSSAQSCPPRLRSGYPWLLRAGGRGIRPACSSRRLYAMPDQSGGSRPSSSTRNGGPCHGAGTLVDVDHRQIFPKNGFRIGAPEVRTRGPSPARPRHEARRRPPPHQANRPHAPSTPSRLRLRRRCSPIPWRLPRRRDRGAAVCTSRPNLEDILISYGMSLT